MTALIKKLNQPSLRDRLAKPPAGVGGPLAQRVAERLHGRRGADLLELLRDLAARENHSLNAQIVRLLRQSLKTPSATSRELTTKTS